jgi:hypothetical protein
MKIHPHILRAMAASFLVIYLFAGALPALADPAEPGDDLLNGKAFLPIVMGPNRSADGVLLGVYTQGSLFSQSTYDNEVGLLDSWSGKPNSIVGTFISFEYPGADYNVPVQLDLIWQNGYTPFINFTSEKTAAQLAQGNGDAGIIATARAFATYARNGSRMAFVAPLQEMNGDWVPYAHDPANFILAFKRIQTIFANQGVPDESVRWVFAPNGWSEPGYEFEKFYPGDPYVDIVAISAYNFGFSTSSQWSRWETPQDVFGPYLPRLRAMAPSKPIFIAQTGTTAQNPSRGTYDHNKKNEWLRDAYIYLSNYVGVKGIIYFNLKNSQNIDWPVYPFGRTEYTGYRDGVNSGNFVHILPEQLMNIPITP